jgi:beta-N-acetylhexosaminidase
MPFVTMIVSMPFSQSFARVLTVAFALSLSTSLPAQTPPRPATPTLDEKIGQMLMVGFRGTSATADSSIAHAIRQYHLGSVILFDVDVERGTADRNIVSPTQLKALVDSVQSFARVPLFVAIDQEGGRVNRLKTIYGFPASVSAQYLGTLNQLDSTTHYAESTARTLKSLGITVNFAPVVDLNTNPDNPVIGRLERSFGADPALVTRHALAVVAAHRAQGVVPVFKHFPGHGSAWNDSHLGMADVTETWREQELAPYRTAIAAGALDAIMTAHIFHGKLDAKHPGTLSQYVIGTLLRKDLGFNGLVFSDDMQMKAIVNFYGLEQAIELAVNAGVDVLTFGNNARPYEPDIAERAFRTVKSLVERGRIPIARIDEAYARILDTKTRYGVLAGAR